MRGWAKLRAALPMLSERELTLVWRDVRRACDVAAIGGADDRAWNRLCDAERKIAAESERRFGRRPDDYLNREGEEELPAIYARIYGRQNPKEGGAE